VNNPKSVPAAWCGFCRTLEVSKLNLDHTGLTIADVDKENNTVRLIVNGSYVEAVFSPKANPDVFDNVKQILIKSMLKVM